MIEIRTEKELDKEGRPKCISYRAMDGDKEIGGLDDVLYIYELEDLGGGYFWLPKTATTDSIGVEDEYQGMGTGRKLLTTAEEDARKYGMTRFLIGHVGNPLFLLHMGYFYTGRSRDFIKDLTGEMTVAEKIEGMYIIPYTAEEEKEYEQYTNYLALRGYREEGREYDFNNMSKDARREAERILEGRAQELAAVKARNGG